MRRRLRGMTALHMGGLSDDLETAKLSLRRRRMRLCARIVTVCHAACRSPAQIWERAKSFELLLEHGADANNHVYARLMRRC
jgi:hypothetical protein